MTAKAVIEGLLGPKWWKRRHDDTALCALVDRVREAFEVDSPEEAVDLIRMGTLHGTESGGLTAVVESICFIADVQEAAGLTPGPQGFKKAAR